MLRAVLKVTIGELGAPSAKGTSTQEFVKIEPQCERCNAEDKHSEQVTPRPLSRGQFLLKLDSGGFTSGQKLSDIRG